MLPSSWPTQFRSDSPILSDGLSKAADVINCPRMPELKVFEATADQMIVAGTNGMEELMITSAPERPRLYATAAGRKPGWARKLHLRKRGKRRLPPFREIHILASATANKALAGIGRFVGRAASSRIYFAKPAVAAIKIPPLCPIPIAEEGRGSVSFEVPS